jgi:ferritin-like metal-binding protein YciE
MKGQYIHMTTQSSSSQSKEVQTITKYLGDMHALESHIDKALENQIKGFPQGHPEALQQVQTFHDTLENHLSAVMSRLQALGGSPTHPVKGAVAAVAGIAAGLYDQVRNEEASKDLRDDYTALNQSIIAYVMLHTTALAFNDQETADLCQRHLTDTSNFVMQIQSFMPALVIQEYEQDGGFSGINKDAAISGTKQVIDKIWNNNPEHG